MYRSDQCILLHTITYYDVPTQNLKFSFYKKNCIQIILLVLTRSGWQNLSFPRCDSECFNQAFRVYQPRDIICVEHVMIYFGSILFTELIVKN